MKNIPFFLLIFMPFVGFAQDIRLENASFEDEPQDATMPQRWHSCKRGSTPDILPGFWGVYLEPYDGDSYVGLITRQDGSYDLSLVMLRCALLTLDVTLCLRYVLMHRIRGDMIT